LFFGKFILILWYFIKIKQND